MRLPFQQIQMSLQDQVVPCQLPDFQVYDAGKSWSMQTAPVWSPKTLKSIKFAPVLQFH